MGKTQLNPKKKQQVKIIYLMDHLPVKPETLRHPLADADNAKNMREALVRIASHLVNLANQNPTEAKKLLVFSPNRDLVAAMEKFGRNGVYRINGFVVVVKENADGNDEVTRTMAIIPRTHRQSEWAKPFLVNVDLSSELPAEELVAVAA
ncbi:MAG: hypothetical protein WCV55_01920 [Candidatus Paceibacterota bacterium]